MRARDKLSAVKVQKAGPGKYNDGAGLWLFKREDGGAQWVLRLTVHGRRREMGLGSLADVTLREARISAERWRGVAREGHDPIKVRERERRAKMRVDNSLEAVAADAYESRKAQLKDDGKAGRWFSPLRLHVLPKLGKVPVEDIDQQDIKITLSPIWHEKADTARKAMERLNIVLRHGAALGLDADLQAVVKAKALLGKTRHTPKNIEAMPWRDVPDFYASLAEPTITHLALRFLIVTGMRSKPVRFAHVDQMDGDVWTIPADLMKGQKGKTSDFRVPLSTEAMRVVELALPHSRDGFIFSSQKRGVISDATMSRLMERRGLSSRPHGFRSSLRTWLAEATDAPYEVAETVIAHTVGGSVERAYRRTDYLEERRVLMEQWGAYAATEQTQEADWFEK